MTGVLLAALIIGVPALAFTLWPLVRKRDRGAWLAVPNDEREQLVERKRAVMRTLRELEFEHDAGHVSDDDYAELRARYETEAGAILTDLDRLGPESPAATAPVAVRTSAWLHPAALATAAVLLLIFGVAIGVGIVRYTEPDATAGLPVPGSRPLAELSPSAPMPGAAPSGEPPRALPPEMLKGMLEAARQALFAGQTREAATAYQAVLKRDRENVDALTHLGLILAMNADGPQGSELVDHALGLFDRALAKDPNYTPALLYTGEVLYRARNDAPGAIRSWEKFVTLVPAGDDRDRVLKLIAEAKSRGK
jgi:cytochrome c-type biogenesis protein CcmH/NrfG